MRPQRVAVLLNAAAGTLARESATMLRERIDSAFAREEIRADIAVLPGKELARAAERALERAKAGALDAVVVGGGDGSIRAVASVLAGTDVPVGVLPLGTLNHFARDLGLPSEIEAAVALIAAGHARPVDVGEVNGETFINNASIGVYPFLVLERERRRRRNRLSKWAAMLVAGLSVLGHLPLGKLSIGTEAGVEPYRSPCVLVGNNAYRFAMPALGRRERLDAGELWLYIAKAQSRLALLWLVVRTVLGRADHLRELRILKGRSVEIRSRQRRIVIALDGEVAALRPPLQFRIRPGALRVFGPADSAPRAGSRL